MIQFPNCKINLGLNILGKRSDGFHNLETVFYPVSLCDALEIIPAPEGVFDFHTTGLEIPGSHKNNLCVKAFQMLKADFGLPGIQMHLHKVIPMGSGLGGGSSDGTFALKMLNDLFNLELGKNELTDYARRLGSDCPFFIENRPLFASEKGDLFQDIALDLSGLFVAIVIPEAHVDTADAYRMVIPKIPEKSLFNLINLPVNDWKELVFNAFEKPITAKFPSVGAIKTSLYGAGAIYAAMSGSGSAVFGLFDNPPKIDRQFPQCFTWTSNCL